MNELLNIVSWALAGAGAVPCAVLTTEIALGLRDRREMSEPIAARTVVIMPAHDEAVGIEDTLRALITVAPAATTVLVVADNCADATAEIARRSGADVIERTHATERGKGYALAFARDYLAALPPDKQPEVVVVLDADCRLAQGSLERLAGSCLATNRPAQARNLLVPPALATPMVQISCFAFMLKNLVRARGLQRLAGAVSLMGTGMAFPWKLFVDLPLASGHLAEDMELGVELIRRGQGAILIPAAEVTSAPAAHADTLEQRKRWEQGFFSVAVRRALPLVGEGVVKARPGLIALGLDLLVPPLALMGALLIGGCILLAGASFAGASRLPLSFLAFVGAISSMAVLAAWVLYGRTLLRPAALVQVPLYLLWKLPLYLRILTQRESRWVRTRRS